jgi:restriction endonuclease S subunit
MSWKKVKLKEVLKQYRIEHLVQNDTEYRQVTISKYDGVTFRGIKLGREIGRKRQFQIDLKKFPKTLMFVRQGVQDGSIGIAPIEVDGCIVTENMPMFSVEGINLEYLKFLLKSPYFYDELNKIETTGSAQKSIHEREILEIEIPFPEIEVQEEIVRKLTSKKNNSLQISNELTHQLTLVKKLRQSFLQEAVQGKLVSQNLADEPASELLKKIKIEKEKLIAEKKLKKEKALPTIQAEEIPFEIPEGWVWCRLGEIVNLVTSGSRDWAKYYSNEGEIFVRMGNLSRENYNLRMDKIQYVKPPKNQEGNRTRLEEDDILISITGEVGNLGLIPKNFGEAYINQHTALVRLNKAISVKYICNLFLSKTLKEQFNAPQRGMKNSFRLTDIDYLLIPLPPLSEQIRIVQKLDELMQTCNDLEASIKESQAQNEKLLQQVLREALRNEGKD